MDIKRKVQSPGSQGNAASTFDDPIMRSGDWQYGRACSPNVIEDEKREEDLAFGVPHEVMDFDPKKSIMAMAADAAGKVAQTVTDKVQAAKAQYKTGVQQTNQLPSELKEAQRMHDLGKQALSEGQAKQ